MERTPGSSSFRRSEQLGEALAPQDGATGPCIERLGHIAVSFKARHAIQQLCALFHGRAAFQLGRPRQQVLTELVRPRRSFEAHARDPQLTTQLLGRSRCQLEVVTHAIRRLTRQRGPHQVKVSVVRIARHRRLCARVAIFIHLESRGQVLGTAQHRHGYFAAQDGSFDAGTAGQALQLSAQDFRRSVLQQHQSDTHSACSLGRTPAFPVRLNHSPRARVHHRCDGTCQRSLRRHYLQIGGGQRRE